MAWRPAFVQTSEVRKPREWPLIVVSQEVVVIDRDPGDVWQLIQASMRSVAVVVGYPWMEPAVSFFRVLVETSVCPLADGGLDEAFGLSFRPWSLDFCALVPGSQLLTFGLEQVGDKTWPVVGHDASNGDFMAREVFGRLAKKQTCRDGLLIGHHRGICHAGVVVDGYVEELPTSAAGLVLGVAGDSMTRLVDAGQPLDVDVQHFTGGVEFLSIGRQFGLQHMDPVKLQAGEYATDGGTAQAGRQSDLDAGFSLPPQLGHALDQEDRRAARTTAGPRASISQARNA